MEKSEDYFYSSPYKLRLRQEPITKTSHANLTIDNTFAVFKTLKNEFLLVYATVNHALMIDEFPKEKTLHTIKAAHNMYITTIKHYLEEDPNDPKKKRDLLLTASCTDRVVKVWDIANNWSCICHLQNTHDWGDVRSVCIINSVEQKKNFLLTSSHNIVEPIKIWDYSTMEGKFVDKIKDSSDDEFTCFIEGFYDKDNSKKTFVISGNQDMFKSFDFEGNHLYQRYRDPECFNVHPSGIVKYSRKTELIESCWDGFVRIWDFHTGTMLKKIKIGVWVNGLCLWNDGVVFAGGDDGMLKMIDLKKGNVEKNFEGHIGRCASVKKIRGEKNQEYLITQGYENDQIRLWII